MAQLQSTGVTGSLVVTGTITAQEFHTEFVSSSILHESGSTVFGNSSDDTHNFTGVATISNRLVINDNTSQPLSSLFDATLAIQGGTNEDPIIVVTDVDTANAAAGVFHQSSTSPGFPALVINAASNGSEQPLISARTNVNNTTGIGGTEVFAVDGDGDATFAGNVDAAGNVEARGYLQAFSTLYMRGTTQIMNKNADGFLTFFERDTSGSETKMNISNVGTLSTSGDATFAGNLTSGPSITATGDTGNSALTLQANTGNWVFTNVQASRNLEISDSDGTGVAMTIDTSANATFAGTITSGVLTVGNSGTSRFTDTSALPLQLNRGLAVDVVGTNGVALGLGSYTTGTTYVDAARIAANLEYDGTTASGDLFLQVNNSGTYSNALIINNDTNATFAGTTTVQGTGDSSFAGNVGIGTTSSSEKLEVHSANAKITANSTADSQTVGFEARYLNHSSLKGTFHYTTGDARLWIDNHFTGNNGNYSDIIFRNKNVGGDQLLKERLIIKGSTGNVGIGTTNPSEKLQVDGAVKFGQNSNIPEAAISHYTNGYLYIKGGSSGLAIGNNDYNANIYLTNADAVQVSTGGSDRMIIDSSGKVGIGNTNPSDYSVDANNLVVGSLSGNNGITILSTSSSGYGSLYFADSTTGNKVYAGYIRYQQNQSNMTFGTNEAEAMRIDLNGKVGIGDTNPSSRLSISDSVSTAITMKSSYDYNLNRDWQIVQNNFGLGNWGGFSIKQSTSQQGVPSVQRFGIDRSGNVGIGIGNSNTAVYSKLQVEGGIKMADDTDAASANKVGTMRYRTGTEYVEVTGTELITNGDFEDGGANWPGSQTSPATVTFSNGKMTIVSPNGESAYRQQSILTPTKTYRATVDVVVRSGTCKLQWGTGTGATSSVISATGSYVFYKTIPATGADALFYCARNGACDVDFDNVSVMEVTAEDASYADMCMQTGASTYEWVNIIRNTY